MRDLDIISDASTARFLIASRQAIGHHLDASLFADPALDILLALFVAHDEDRRISVGECCTAARVPLTTGLRWIAALEERRLIERRPDRFDRRRVYLALPQHAIESLRDWLGEIAQRA